jgi:hypothetical protein
MVATSLATFKSTDPKDIVPLVVICLLVVVLIVGVVSNYAESITCFEQYLYDDEDDSPGLEELNRVYRKEDDIEYQLHGKDEHESWTSSSINIDATSQSTALTAPGADIILTKQNSIVDKRDLLRPSPSFFRKSYSFKQKKPRTLWDDRLAKLNTPQVRILVFVLLVGLKL